MIPEHHTSPNYPLHFGLSALAGLIGGVLSFFLLGRVGWLRL
jgi:hypothetical protein